jgi:hypothetical protein
MKKNESVETVDLVFEIDNFKKILNDFNITIKQDDYLNKCFLYLLDYKTYKETNKNEIIHLKYNQRTLRQLTFLEKIIVNINKLKNHNNFDKIRNHLNLLTDTNFAQNDYTTDLYGIKKEKSDKLWELFLLISLMNIDSEIIFVDDPYNSTTNGKNVDIIANLEGIKFGFECKVPSNNILKTNSFFDLLKNGIEQIRKSDIDKGIVCFNMKNVINHELFLNCFGDNNYYVFEDIKKTKDLLEIEIKENWDKIQNQLNIFTGNNGEKNINEKIDFFYSELFKNDNKVCKGWFNYYATASICMNNKNVACLYLQRINTQGFIPSDFCLESVLANQINNGFFGEDKNFSLLKFLKESQDSNSKFSII